MVGPLLREPIIIIFFCNIFVETQDFLEYYKPKPGLPRELNEWLSDVQQYKGDFRLIRAIAEKQEKDGLDYDTDTLSDTNTKLLDNLEEENEYLDEVPKNDIYPHMYKQKKNPYENSGTSFDKPSKNKKYASKKQRQRRHSNNNMLHDKQEIDINPKSDDGVIERPDDKYPDRFFNNLKDNVNKKREIQIDVLNDGKLVKQIRESDKDPKSIVLNIQSLDKFKNPPPLYKPEPIATENEVNQIKPLESEVKVFSAQRSADSESYQMNNKELSNSFKNLFNANENLNTDSSIAREKLGQTALLYRVTLPDPDNIFISEDRGTIKDQDKKTIKEDNQGGFNKNYMKDMSRFWTATEKNQMQKGIEFARGDWNGRPLQTSLQPIDSDGFERVKSVVIDADGMKDKYKQNSMGDITRQNKRESKTIEGRVRINAEGNNKIILPSKDKFDNYIPENGNQINEERKGDSEQKKTTPYVMLIDSHTRNKIMEGAIESIQTIDEHSYGQNNIESNNPLGENPLDSNVSSDSAIDEKLNGDIGKIEVMAEDTNVDELIPEEYRETTPEFIIPAPEGASIQNIEDIGVQSNEQNEIKPANEERHDQKDENEKGMNKPVEASEDIVDELNAHQQKEHSNIEVIEPEGAISLENRPNNHEHLKIHAKDEGLSAEETVGNVHVSKLHHNSQKQKPQDIRIEDIRIVADTEEPKLHDISHEETFHHHHPPYLKNEGIDNADQRIENEEPNKDIEEPEIQHGSVEKNLITQKEYQLPKDFMGSDEQMIETDNHLGHKEKSKYHTGGLPLTKIHKVDQHIHDHLVVTRIETITVMEQNEETGGVPAKILGEREQNMEDEQQVIENDSLPELQEAMEPAANVCFKNSNRHHKTVKIFTKPLNKLTKKEKLSMNHVPAKNNDKLSVEVRQCKDGHCANEDENMEQTHLNAVKMRRQQRKHKRYKERIRYNVGREENDEFLPNDSDEIPAFGRHLQGVEYVYDVDIGQREQAFLDDKEASSTVKNTRVGMLHKNSVEGDYGDEEDSMTREKKKNSELIKKTDNVFANPVIATTEEDDDDEDYYAESGDIDSNNNDKTEDGGGALSTDSQKLISFGRRLHKQAKPPRKEDKENKVGKGKGKKVRETRESPSQKFLDKSEFQHWPQFVISDKLNEENLRKRSLASKRTVPRRNIFPLSSKDYFTKSKSKRRDSSQLSLDKPKTTSTTEKLFLDFDKPKDNDMEVKLNLNLDMDDKVQKLSGMTDITLFPISTLSTSGNQSVSVTEEEECDSETPKVSVGNVCEENENFNKTKVALTTVLSIIPDTQGEISNETYTADDFVKLDDILTGHLPSKILEYIRSHMRKDKNLRERFLKGMKKSHGGEAFQNLPDVTNEESKKLINAMANLMNRLQITSTCQTLPGKLLRYLKSATRVRLEDALARAKEMEEVEFDDIQNQDTFIFQSNSRADNLEEKVRVLKDLLAKYNHLPDRCKPRAEPVREYVLNHLKLLTNMLSVAQLSPPRPKKTVQGQADEYRTDTPGESLEKSTTAKDLVEKQLESLGLGSRHSFRPKFSLEDLMAHQRKAKEILDTDQAGGTKKSKRDSDREHISEKYEKLRQAVKKERTKRDSERRVAENFGRLSIDDYNGEGMNMEGTGSFESPLVFSF